MKYSRTQDAVLQALQGNPKAKKIGDKQIRSSTFEALERRGAIRQTDSGYRITERGEKRLRQISGENLVDHRPNKLQLRWYDRHLHTRPTVDSGQPDYQWWDRARRGAVDGYEIAGVFIKPIASKKAAWVLGQAPQFGFEDDDTAEAVNGWFRDNHSDILLAMEEAAIMGDYYLVVNPDETVTVVPPDVVEPIVDERDFSQHIGWRITQTYPHPTTPWITQTIVDEYTRTSRTRTMIRQNGQQTTQRFRNLTGLLPVIHIPNNRRGGEMFGHPEAEALVNALHEYGAVTDAAVEGNLRQGRPTPVFERLGSNENLEAFINAFGQEKQRTLPDGTVEQWTEIAFSSDMAVYLGESGTFKYAQPGSFTADTMNILQILFYLVIQHTEQPEFIWGSAIQGSRASTDSQMPPFTRWAEKEQGRAEHWLIQLVQYVRALKALYEPGVTYDADEMPSIQWAPLTDKDGKLTLEAIKVALTLGGWEPEDVVPYMPLDIDNPEEIVQKIIQRKEENRRMMNGEDQPFVQAPQEEQADEDDLPEEEQQETFIERVMGEAHSGVMIAFQIPNDIATGLALATRQAGIESVPPDDMHLTLVYLGDMAEMPEGGRDMLADLLEIFSAEMTAIEGIIGGVGRFNASKHSDGEDVLYASFDAPDLPEFRQRLVDDLEAMNIPVPKDHGFTPHITLAYVDRATDAGNLRLPTIDLRFDAVTLYWGDEQQTFALNGGYTRDSQSVVEEPEAV